MTDNLELWNRFADIDPAETKPITGKPYKGTSPKPHYIIKCLTELFGPAGVGFGWETLAEGFQPLGDEVLHWCRIRFWHGEGKGFESYGQTKAVMKTRNGLMVDEDAPKKSLTDAVTKAAATVGVGANIYLGRWDDSRYVAEVAEGYREKENPNPPKTPLPDGLEPAKPPREVLLAIADIEGCQDQASLKDVWANLYKNYRMVADMPQVIAAKDKRKSELTKDAA